MEVPQKKLKIEIPYNPVIPLLDIYPKKTKMLICKDICTPMFIAELFTVAKMWKQSKWTSIDEWIKKIQYIYTVKYYSAIKKKEILPFAVTWMDLEGIMFSEISQAEKGKQHMISFICGI